jgi:hypothetical protein
LKDDVDVPQAAAATHVRLQLGKQGDISVVCSLQLRQLKHHGVNGSVTRSQICLALGMLQICWRPSLRESVLCFDMQQQVQSYKAVTHT